MTHFSKTNLMNINTVKRKWLQKQKEWYMNNSAPVTRNIFKKFSSYLTLGLFVFCAYAAKYRFSNYTLKMKIKLKFKKKNEESSFS